ncbi:NHL domain-containing protein [Edaphobacter acidisoli]|uniref:NHL domain-containing protein n=1 Tax=Edaphobacter acidisoli TaxID=2040573 RepID=UPI0021DFE4BC|nr:Ig-like domain repeat protein [Edaphobacter acidisoli]
MGPQSTTPTIPTPRLPLVLRWALALMLTTPLAAQAAAPLLLPSAIAYDSSGNLYIAEASRHDIRKLDPSGNITTIAGTGVQGFAGDSGPATAAELDSPQGLAIDASGNIYIADTHNHRIREVKAANGNITTIAGTGAAGNSGDSGPATAAELDLPTALAIDASGNLYIADTHNHRIREINAATGIITTIAGTGTEGYSGDNGPATAAELDSPQGLAIDTTGNLYIADTHNHRIREVIATTGIITTIAGTGTAGNSGDSGPATAATLRLPRGIATDATGNLYLTDVTAQSVRKVNATTGQITTIAGSGTQGFSGDGSAATSATLDSPRAAAISPSGLATFADAANQRIRQLNSANPPIIQTIAGPGATTPTGPTNTPAPAIVALTASSTSITAGQPITITASVATTTGTPTGTVTLYDNAVALATIPLPPSGQISYSTTALASGANTITASYSGDTNFARSTSSPATIAVNTVSGTTTGGADFTLAAKAATTQTLLPGTSASFTFTLQTEGTALSSPITLSASGVPSLYAASFNPSYLPPGTASGTVTLTIAAKTTNALQTDRRSSSAVLAFLAFPLTLFGFKLRNRQEGYSKGSNATANKRQRRASYQPGVSSGELARWGRKPQVDDTLDKQRAEGPLHRIVRDAGIFLLLLFPALFLTGCGARTNTTGENTPTATPYTITVTGTATTPTGTTLAHSTTVTLLIQQAN